MARRALGCLLWFLVRRVDGNANFHIARAQSEQPPAAFVQYFDLYFVQFRVQFIETLLDGLLTCLGG